MRREGTPAGVGAISRPRRVLSSEKGREQNSNGNRNQLGRQQSVKGGGGGGGSGAGGGSGRPLYSWNNAVDSTYCVC